MRELGQAFTRSGWPSRTIEEIRKELLRLHERWKKQQHKSLSYLRIAAENTCLWTDESDDEDDIFMPSKKAKTTSSSKYKAKTTSLSKGKEKTTSSSKGKSSRSKEDDVDDFMWLFNYIFLVRSYRFIQMYCLDVVLS